MDIESTLNGCIHRQGLKFGVSAWLDMGSKEWQQIEASDKAKAYQAALCCGWTDAGLIAFMTKRWSPRIDEEWGQLTIDTLKQYLEAFPVPIEEVRPVVEDKPIFRKFQK